MAGAFALSAQVRAARKLREIKPTTTAAEAAAAAAAAAEKEEKEQVGEEKEWKKMCGWQMNGRTGPSDYYGGLLASTAR